MSDVYGCPFNGQWLCHKFEETDEEVGITFEPYKKQCLLESISKKAANLNLPCEIWELWSDAYAKCMSWPKPETSHVKDYLRLIGCSSYKLKTRKKICTYDDMSSLWAMQRPCLPTCFWWPTPASSKVRTMVPGAILDVASPQSISFWPTVNHLPTGLQGYRACYQYPGLLRFENYHVVSIVTIASDSCISDECYASTRRKKSPMMFIIVGWRLPHHCRQWW